MNIQDKICYYISSLPDKKQNDIQKLHDQILNIFPECKLWFLDGRDESGKIVSNPNIGYGSQTINYINGKTREFYQIGLSANSTGISVYIMGIEDKKHLINKYLNEIGKATVTSYCIKFKSLKDIDIQVLKTAILDGINLTK